MSLSLHQIVNVLKFRWIITVIVTPYGLSLYTSLWNIFLVSPIWLLPLGFISLDPFYRYGNIWRLGQGIFINSSPCFYPLTQPSSRLALHLKQEAPPSPAALPWATWWKQVLTAWRKFCGLWFALVPGMETVPWQEGFSLGGCGSG